MKDQYLTPLRITAAVCCMLLCHSPLLAQRALKGMVRVKVSKGLATQLESRAFSRTPTGEVQTGIASLDRRNRQFKARRFTRVFPHAGKYESRHRKHGLHLWYTIVVDDTIPVSQMVASYRSDAEILSAEPVYEKAIVGSGRKSFGPSLSAAHAGAPLPDASNDPMLDAQWHYHNTGQTGGTPGADIKLFEAWKTETGNSSVIVAVTDGGVQTDHPDLAANLWRNADEVAGNGRDDDNNGYIDDLHGYGFVNNSAAILPDNHGTHVAGTIAAVNNNGLGVAGIAGGSGHGDGVRIMSCAVFSKGTSDGFAQAYVYSADNGAVVSQNSWGYTTPHVYEQVVLDAIDYFIAEAGKDANGVQTGPMNGGLVVFSAGNYNDEAPYYPAAYAPVLAVTSTTHKDRKAAYANYGTWIDIAAPGGETYQDQAQGVVSTLTGGQYGTFMGTSMACPHVSGVAALFLSKFGQQGLLPETLRKKLLQSVDDISAVNPEYAGKLGSGRLNAQLALRPADPAPIAGGISLEKWTGIPGTTLSEIPVTAEPTATALLDNFTTPANAGDQYGQRLRGFIQPPADGYYTFFIASNDRSTLALSTDESEGNKRIIASVNAYTNPGQWDKYASQASAKIYLEANRKYYIEALHKEGVGSDHLAVGWQLPDGAMERPVPGTRLSPYEITPSESSPLCSASGTISREYWTDIPGSTVSDIPVGSRPDGIMSLTSFEGPVGAGSHYGARISGYLCAPATGDYVFWIASNDQSELWLSRDGDPANKVRIAFVSGATGIRQWDKNTSQRSARIQLTAGKTYYIEALHKQGVGSDHIAVGWQLPDGTLERPMRGDYLSPFVHAASHNDYAAQAAAFAGAEEESQPRLAVYPNPVQGDNLTIAFENVSAPKPAFADVEISDLSGVALYTQRLDCRGGCGIALPVRERLQPGIYIVRLRAGDRLFTEKLIVP